VCNAAGVLESAVDSPPVYTLRPRNIRVLADGSRIPRRRRSPPRPRSNRRRPSLPGVGEHPEAGPGPVPLPPLHPCLEPDGTRDRRSTRAAVRRLARSSNRLSAAALTPVRHSNARRRGAQNGGSGDRVRVANPNLSARLHENGGLVGSPQSRATRGCGL
jgi:hypothetical protein